MKRTLILVALLLLIPSVGSARGIRWAQLNEDDVIDSLGTNKLGWVDVRAYSDLATALTTLGASIDYTLVIPDSQTVTANDTVPTNIALYFYRGGEIGITSGNTLTINGPFDAGSQQVFSDSGNVIFGGASVKMVNPEWFAPVGSDYYEPITKAIASAVNVGHVHFSSLLRADSVIVLSNNDFTMSGDNVECGINNQGTGAALTLSGTRTCFKDMQISGNASAYGDSGSTTYGLEVSGAVGELIINNCVIKNNGSHGIYMHGGVWIVSIQDSRIWYNFGDGIHADNHADQNGNNLSIINCEIANLGSGISWGAVGLNVVGCEFGVNYGYGIKIDATNTNVYAPNIVGNYFESNYLGPIYTTTGSGKNALGFNIAGNYFLVGNDTSDVALDCIVFAGSGGILDSFISSSNTISLETGGDAVDGGDILGSSVVIQAQYNDYGTYTNLGDAIFIPNYRTTTLFMAANSYSTDITYTGLTDNDLSYSDNFYETSPATKTAYIPITLPPQSKIQEVTIPVSSDSATWTCTTSIIGRYTDQITGFAEVAADTQASISADSILVWQADYRMLRAFDYYLKVVFSDMDSTGTGSVIMQDVEILW